MHLHLTALIFALENSQRTPVRTERQLGQRIAAVFVVAWRALFPPPDDGGLRRAVAILAFEPARVPHEGSVSRDQVHCEAGGDEPIFADAAELETLITGAVWPLVAGELEGGLSFDLPAFAVGLGDIAPRLDDFALTLTLDRPLDARGEWLIIEGAVDGYADLTSPDGEGGEGEGEGGEGDEAP